MLINILAWVGSAALCLAPFIIDSLMGKIIAILGLTALIPQTLQKHAYNLTLLNCIGIVGYLYEGFIK